MTHVLEYAHPSATKQARLVPTVCGRWVTRQELDNQHPTCPDCKSFLKDDAEPDALRGDLYQAVALLTVGSPCHEMRR